VVNQLNNLALSKMASKQYDEANSLLSKSLQICEAYTHPELSDRPATSPKATWNANYLSAVLAMFAECRINEGKMEEALEYLQRLHALNVSLYSDEDGRLRPHLSVLKSFVKLGIHYFNMNDNANAENCFNEVMRLDLEYAKSHVDVTRATTGTALHYLGKMNLQKEEFGVAKELLDRSWKIHRNVIGITNQATARVILDIVRALVGLEDYNRARTLVEFCGKIFEKNGSDPKSAEEAMGLHQHICINMQKDKPEVSFAMRRTPPLIHRHGINFYAPGESPEEIAKKQKQQRKARDEARKWKQEHKM